MLLYLHGKGTIWYDDAVFGERDSSAPNRLQNGGFEPPASYVYDLALEKRSGGVTFRADFENATLGKVKQLGPDEFYLYAFPNDKPHSGFLWFHFRLLALRKVKQHLSVVQADRQTGLFEETA